MSTIAPARQRRGEASRPRGARHPAHPRDALLYRYADARGLRREIVRRPGAGGSTLVIDRLALGGADERLVAHLAADEPPENARIVCALYLADGGGRRCRRVRREDLTADPLSALRRPPPNGSLDQSDPERQVLRDPHGGLYRLAAAPAGRSIPELRWRRSARPTDNGNGETVRLREVVGRLESYEPARSMSAHALTRYGNDAGVSTSALRGELSRLNKSRIVLNRALREAVLAALAEQEGLTMSEIAVRCGRVKQVAVALLISSIPCRSGCG